MKSMRKWLGIVAAGVMCFAMGTTVLAAPSPSANGVVNEISAATDANGNAIKAEITKLDAVGEAAVKELDSVDTVKTLLGDAYVEGMEVLDAQEVTVPEGTVFPATLTFKVPGVVEGTKVAVLHYDVEKKAWEVVESKAGNGTIEATFNSLSPVAFVVDKDTMASTGNATSPKTGESTVVMVFALVALVAAGSAWALSTKKRA